MVGPRGGRLDPGQTQSLAYAFLEVEPSKPALTSLLELGDPEPEDQHEPTEAPHLHAAALRAACTRKPRAPADSAAAAAAAAAVAAAAASHLPGGAAAADLLAKRLGRAAAQQAQLAAVLQVHVDAKAAWREARAKALRERMAALKASDLEGYIRMARLAKSSRIDGLLAQTDACLRRLTDRLCAAGSAAQLQPPDEGAAGPSAAAQPEPASALEESSVAWNRLAAAIDTGEPRAQPAMLAGGELREYQMQGLRWMLGLRVHGINGILADEMGLGKTIQVIALAAQLAAGPAPWAGPLLIAVPASVLPNWEGEFEAWAPTLRVVSYRGNAEARSAIFSRQMAGARPRVGTAAGAAGEAGPSSGRHPFHVVLTTYECLMGKDDRPRLARIPWHYIVLDEGHRLKNAGCKLNAELRAYSAANRLLLTGTPISNNLSELWSLLNFLMPTLFGSSDDFHAWFSGGGAGGGEAAAAVADDPDAAAEAALLSEEEELIVTSRLHQVLRPFMLRRMKESVASELPSKQERLLLCPPSAYQRSLFGLIGEELGGGPGGGGGGEGGKAAPKGISNIVMEMRNICNHPLISRLHPGGSESLLPPHPLPAEVRLCGKLEVLDRALVKLRAGGHRVLLFCTMTRLLDVLEGYLEWRGFEHLRLDGGTGSGERGELVARFNDPASSAFIFLLSVRAGGVGLNLQSADTVIMYDTDWNPQMDLQAQARAHRIGQTKNVLVLRMATEGSVEERIIGVAAGKRSMADRSITGGLFDGKASAAERQRFLLEIIRSSSAQQAQQAAGRGAAQGAADLSDAQLNEALARSDEERALFEAEDRRRAGVEQASWRGLGGAGRAAAAPAFARLAGPEEVAALVAAALEQARPVDPDAGKEFGRGKRNREEEPPPPLNAPSSRAAKRRAGGAAEPAATAAAAPSAAAPPAARPRANVLAALDANRVPAWAASPAGKSHAGGGSENAGRLLFERDTERLRDALGAPAADSSQEEGAEPGSSGNSQAKRPPGRPGGALLGAAALAAGVLVTKTLTASDLDGQHVVNLPTAPTKAAFPDGLPESIAGPGGQPLRTSTRTSTGRTRVVIHAQALLASLGAKQGDVAGICRSADGQPVFEVNTPRLWAAVNGAPGSAAPTAAVLAGPSVTQQAAQQQQQQQPPPVPKPPAAAVPALELPAARATAAPAVAQASGAAAAASGAAALAAGVLVVKTLTASDVDGTRPVNLPVTATEAAFPAAAGGIPASIAGPDGQPLRTAITSAGRTRVVIHAQALLISLGAKQGDVAGICRSADGQPVFEVNTPRLWAAVNTGDPDPAAPTAAVLAATSAPSAAQQAAQQQRPPVPKPPAPKLPALELPAARGTAEPAVEEASGAAALAAGVLVVKTLTASDVDGLHSVNLPVTATEAAFPAAAGGIPASIAGPDGQPLRIATTSPSAGRTRVVIYAQALLASLGAKQGDVAGICRSADGQPVFEVNTPRLWAAVNAGAPAAGPTAAAPAPPAAAQQPKQRPPAAKAPRITGAKRAAAAPASPRRAGSAATPPPAEAAAAAPAAAAAAAAEAGPAGWEVIIVKALSASDVAPVRPAMVLPSPAVQAAFPGAAAGGLPASIPGAGGGAALALSTSESGGKIKYMLGTREYLAAAAAQKGDAAGILRGPAGALLFEVGTPRMQAALLRAAAAGPSPGGKRRSSGKKLEA